MARTFVQHSEVMAPGPSLRGAIAAKAFRPFFLLSAAYALLVVPLWLAIIAGVARPSVYLDPLSWHAHEMIFGYAVAVIAGFLLTAVGNWTQRETLVGAPLLGLAGLWALGRVAMLAASSLPRGVAAAIDLALLPLLIVAVARPLVAAKSRRNFVMLAILGALFAANAIVHLDALGLLPAGSARRACSVAVDVVVLVMLLIAGRVVPMFMRNATGNSSIRSHPTLDAATIAGAAALSLADAAGVDARLSGVVAGVVAVLAAARAVHWGGPYAAREPLLWILHAGYGWIVVGLVMRAAAAHLSELPSTLATHALTVGAIGSLTLGMMARVSLGHTGRALAATPAMRWAFLAMTVAALVRVAGPVVAPDRHFTWLVVAGVLWSFAFATFLAVYAPILASPRRDGRSG